MGYSLATVKGLADTYGWQVCDINNDYRMVSFRKENIKMNIYYSVQSVSIVKDDEEKTRDFIRNVSLRELKSLFEDPEW